MNVPGRAEMERASTIATDGQRHGAGARNGRGELSNPAGGSCGKPSEPPYR